MTPDKGIFIMNRIKALIIAQMVLFLCLLNPAVAAREVASGQPDISLKHNMLSVRLNGSPLDQVLKEIERQGEVCFYIDNSMSKKKIWSQFTDLRLKEGIKKILFQYNHVMIFDWDGNLAEVHILGDSDQRDKQVLNKNRTKQINANKPILSITPEDRMEESGFEVVKNCLPPGEDDEGKTLGFKAREKVDPPPGELPEEACKIKKNVEPPGKDTKENKALNFNTKEKLSPPDS